MKNWPSRPDISSKRAAMCSDIQPISIPIIFFIRKLATVNPNLQTRGRGRERGRVLARAVARGPLALWRAIRLEARDEFFSGHYGARAFEVLRTQHEAWRRAQYMAVRDGLIGEWRPRRASEFILIDTMTQAYVMQLEWTERGMTRFHGRPRVETYEYRQWVEERQEGERAGR